MFPVASELLISQGLSSLCSAASKYLATILGGHSLSEAVLLLALELLGLVSSEHCHAVRPPFVS